MPEFAIKSGRRFDAETSANPVLEEDPSLPSNARSLSFISQVPPEAPFYIDAQDGALNFTATLGTAFGRKVMRLNTIYNGRGGPFGPDRWEAPPDEWNFWLYVE